MQGTSQMWEVVQRTTFSSGRLLLGLLLHLRLYLSRTFLHIVLSLYGSTKILLLIKSQEEDRRARLELRVMVGQRLLNYGQRWMFRGNDELLKESQTTLMEGLISIFDCFTDIEVMAPVIVVDVNALGYPLFLVQLFNDCSELLLISPSKIVTLFRDFFKLSEHFF